MSEGIELIQIARIVKSNGTDGELLASFRDVMPEDIDIQEPVFIYSDGLPVPFFIEKIVPKGRDKALLRLATSSRSMMRRNLPGRPYMWMPMIMRMLPMTKAISRCLSAGNFAWKTELKQEPLLTLKTFREIHVYMWIRKTDR